MSRKGRPKTQADLFAEGSDTTSKPGSSGWHVALGRARDGRPYLGDPKVVEKLVVDFIHTVANGDTVAEARAEVERLARIFAGKDPAYGPVGDWTPKGLAAEIKVRLGITARDPEAAVREALAMLAHAVYRELRAGDPEAAKPHLRVFAREWVSLLLGTPSPHPELFGRG